MAHMGDGGAVCRAAAGQHAALLYDWTGQARWAAYLAATNESTWEHMKLLAVPVGMVSAGTVPAQRFQRHGLRWRCSIRPVLRLSARGQILHLTGVRSRCRALT